jgi:hypothetical protein
MRTLLFLAISVLAAQAAPLPDPLVMAGWVLEMKAAPRGPFQHLRWFCNDGTVLELQAQACRDHGGGVQHGEWTDRVKTMRQGGYSIANIYAGMDPAAFLDDPHHPGILKQMILEQFLIKADDGWIYRKARYYRGVLQAEDEDRGAGELLRALASEPAWRNQRFLVLREAVRLLPRNPGNAPISEMRQLSLAIADRDPGFIPLRTKLHVRPEPDDGAQVRNHAATKGFAELTQAYERLAATIDEIFQPREAAPELIALSKQIKDPTLSQMLLEGGHQLLEESDPSLGFAIAGRLMALLRRQISDTREHESLLPLLDMGVTLEDGLFTMGNALVEMLPAASLGQRIDWLNACSDLIYGLGLISSRQWQALGNRFSSLLKANPYLIDFQEGLEYAARVPAWADRNLGFHFSETVAHLATIEPISRRFIHDRLHNSILAVYSRILESLTKESARRWGIQNELFGMKFSVGITALNPGIARGVIRIPENNGDPAIFTPDAIVVLPATTQDLPLVAGIITAGHGNSLSHVQLLARNLGIPNVTVARHLLPLLYEKNEKKVVLAASPGGVVQLVEDDVTWDNIFVETAKARPARIRLDLEKLDLATREFIPLEHLRSTDSGRICGPKAANLGELKHHFPEAVANGLVIPFGWFRALLDHPLEPGGPTTFDWIQHQHCLIRLFKNDPRQQARLTQVFLSRLHNWILTADPGEAFCNTLKAAMEKTFGRDGTYGVFVRSDTNVEDLPGFSGAGLNLTRPNVVGFENILAAISQVWASPFTLRAHSFRQAMMETPEHVYPSVLLMKTVPVEKSGVMVTVDPRTGRSGRLTIAVNEGVGGVVSGQTAEELLVHTESGQVEFLAQATEPQKRIVLEKGGMAKAAASGTPAVLSEEEIRILTAFSRSIPDRFPMLRDDQNNAVPADIEFGFHGKHLALFQIRPFLESRQARQNLYLNSLDQKLNASRGIRVDLDHVPDKGLP